MKMEGRNPSPRLSACSSAVVTDSRQRKLKLRPHYEVEADDCRVVPSSSRVATGEADDFPFFHAKGRRRKVCRTGGRAKLHVNVMSSKNAL